MLDFERDEAPRAEFVQAFYRGVWRENGKRKAMRLDRGFYTKGVGRIRHFVQHDEGEDVLVMSPWQRLKAYSIGVPALLLVVCLTLTVMISIFSFRMLMRLSTQVRALESGEAKGGEGAEGLCSCGSPRRCERSRAPRLEGQRAYADAALYTGDSPGRSPASPSQPFSPVLLSTRATPTSTVATAPSWVRCSTQSGSR